jgi:hypothetical protein
VLTCHKGSYSAKAAWLPASETRRYDRDLAWIRDHSLARPAREELNPLLRHRFPSEEWRSEWHRQLPAGRDLAEQRHVQDTAKMEEAAAWAWERLTWSPGLAPTTRTSERAGDSTLKVEFHAALQVLRDAGSGAHISVRCSLHALLGSRCNAPQAP